MAPALICCWQPNFWEAVSTVSQVPFLCFPFKPPSTSTSAQNPNWTLLTRPTNNQGGGCLYQTFPVWTGKKSPSFRALASICHKKVLSNTRIYNVHNRHGAHWPCAVCYLHNHTLPAAFCWPERCTLVSSDHSQIPLWLSLLLEMRSSWTTTTPHSVVLLLLPRSPRPLNVDSLSESCPALSSFVTWPICVSGLNPFHSTLTECPPHDWQCSKHWALEFTLMIYKHVSQTAFLKSVRGNQMDSSDLPSPDLSSSPLSSYWFLFLF